MTKSWIQVFSGAPVDFFFDYEHPEQFTWPLVSVAHHLAGINRYTGAGRRTYTVAEHSWRVGFYAADLVRKYGTPEQIAGGAVLKAARAGIVHDVVESVIGDVNSPLKNMPFMAGYKDFEKRLAGMVDIRFGVEAVWVKHDGRDFNVVHSADLTALEFERAQLLAKPPMPWKAYEILPVVESQAFAGELGLSAEEACELFLNGCKAMGLK